MIKWTTPTITCTIPSNLEFEYIILTLKQNDIVINKTIQSEEVQYGKFDVTFTQEETGQFSTLFGIEAQLNIVNGEQRLATQIEILSMSKNLLNEVF